MISELIFVFGLLIQTVEPIYLRVTVSLLLLFDLV